MVSLDSLKNVVHSHDFPLKNVRVNHILLECEKFNIARAVRTSLSGYRDEGRLINIPLWAIGLLTKLEG